MTEYSIGVDIGGTNLRAAAVTRDGKMIDKISGVTNLQGGRDRVILDLVSNIRELRDRVGAPGLTGVGIGIPGFIMLDKGMIVGSHNMPGFDNYPVRDDISHRLGSQVILENDANAAAPAHPLPVSRVAAEPSNTPAASQKPVVNSRDTQGISSPTSEYTAATMPGKIGGLTM